MDSTGGTALTSARKSAERLGPLKRNQKHKLLKLSVSDRFHLLTGMSTLPTAFFVIFREHALNFLQNASQSNAVCLSTYASLHSAHTNTLLPLSVDSKTTGKSYPHF